MSDPKGDVFSLSDLEDDDDLDTSAVAKVIADGIENNDYSIDVGSLEDDFLDDLMAKAPSQSFADDSNDEEDDDIEPSWVVDLETVLLDKTCDFGTVRNICCNRPVPDNLRTQVWMICLGVNNSSLSFSDLGIIFDLAEQEEIKEACHEFVISGKSNMSSDKNKAIQISTMVTIITHYCKSTSREFKSDSNWLNILDTLLCLKPNLEDKYVYAMFAAILNKYVPRVDSDQAYHVFRLLLQFHEPALSSLFDTLHLSIADFSCPWFTSLLSDVLRRDVLPSLYDVYFQMADPFFIFFLSLVFLLNAKEAVIDKTRDEVLAILTSIPGELELDDVGDLCTLAQHYSSKTPSSLRKEFSACLFGDAMPDNKMLMSLCLPISLEEILHQDCSFSLVDARPPHMYNSGHASTAYNIDSGLLLTNPTEFDSVLSALITHTNGPLCISGHGREDEDATTTMIVARLLRRNCPAVGVLKGGYANMHQNPAGFKCLSDHNDKACPECLLKIAAKSHNFKTSSIPKQDSINTNNSSIIGAGTLPDGTVQEIGHMFTRLKTKADTLVSRISSFGGDQKPYRNTGNVFSISDDETPVSDEATSNYETNPEAVSIDVWQKECISSYPCMIYNLVNSERPVKGHLILKKEHLYLLRDNPAKPGMAFIVSRQHLTKIVKITVKKKCPELITFKFGVTNADGVPEVKDQSRVFIEKAGDATKDVKMQIYKLIGPPS